HAGGAETHLHEIFGRLARGGHAIDLVASGWPGAPREAHVDGRRVHRSGGRHTFALRARGVVRRLLRANSYDVVVEDRNKLPLFRPTLTDRPFCALVPHLFGATAFREASWPIASVVWAAERPIPWAYRRAWFHAISESTRDDLVRRGVPRERIEVIYPGVDATWYAPDAAEPRAREPTFLYVGRLKRYKGVEIALRALVLARQARPDLVLEIAGGGDDRARLERLAGTLGLGEAARFLGFVSETDKRRLLRRAWAAVLASPRGLGHLERGGGGVRYPRARVRQSRPPGVGSARRDRLSGAARRCARARGPDACARCRSDARGAAGERCPRVAGAALLGGGGPGDGSASPAGHR